LALRWFRFRKREEEAPQQVAPLEEVAPPEVEAVAEDEAAEADAAAAPAKRKRRRGSRGGRGRKKTAERLAPEAAVFDAADAPAAGEPRQEAGRSAPERKPERKPARSRRRTPTKRAALPAAKRELLISVDVGEQRVAVLEDDRVAEVYLERPERRSIAGNIYLGQVDNVLPGMEAAFVEIGLEKNGFLYVDEIVVPELEGRKGARKIQDLIKRGETVLVQAVKDPMKSKGARLTTEISLPGRYLVYVPNGEGSGVSRRLDDAERTRLKEILKGLDPKGGGIIVRTAAEGASADDIERDLVFLQRLWKTIQGRAEKATAPELVYEEAELPLRIVRDLFAGDVVGMHIDDDRTYRRIVSYLKKTSPHMVERVHRYREKTPLFEVFGVDEEIRSTLRRRVDLPSGGYLVFDYAEAFTVIDVNTGRFVGSRAKGSTGRLEDTIVKNNLEAVKEVVRQLRLRDIGGIIVIDFIDMANPKNRETVEEALRAELERDRTKTYVVEISPLGLVEMTRQNVTDGPREILTTKCAVCEGGGFVVSEATHALDIERRLRAIAHGSRAQAFRVAVHPRVLQLLAGPGGERLEALEAAARRRFYLVPAGGNGHLHLDHFEVLQQGKREALQPEAAVEEGSSVELKLVEVGLYDATSGVGKLDGVEIVVAGAAKLVGKKVKVNVGRVLDGMAFATLAGGAPQQAPITFEAEAEKPTRASSRKKPASEVADEAAVRAAEPPEATSDEADIESHGAPKKKRARRGSRGGRGRKKAVAEPVAEAAEEEATEEPAAPKTPRIHVPPVELTSATQPPATDGTPSEPEAEAEPEPTEVAEAESTDGQPKRKRTRRGTRGGRRRRKTSAEAAATNGGGEESVDPGNGSATAPSEYVPMSEWIEDFERARRSR
jgi:ribonuclease G